MHSWPLSGAWMAGSTIWIGVTRHEIHNLEHRSRSGGVLPRRTGRRSRWLAQPVLERGHVSARAPRGTGLSLYRRREAELARLPPIPRADDDSARGGDTHQAPSLPDVCPEVAA